MEVGERGDCDDSCMKLGDVLCPLCRRCKYLSKQEKIYWLRSTTFVAGFPRTANLRKSPPGVCWISVFKIVRCLK
jgi:hypothetical protein